MLILTTGSCIQLALGWGFKMPAVLPKEDIIHKQIGSYLRAYSRELKDKGLTYYTYSPAGEKRHIRTAVTLKKKGVQRGDPDYRLQFVKNDVMYTLFVEIKRSKRSKLTDEQTTFFNEHENLKNAKCYIAYGLKDFVKIVIAFISALK